ncbi:MAG: DNA polymerase III subunit delta' [Phycisphaerales bacterium]|nr:MAG: DNA polymerase III subunit delta' [Phycisphaerales bacterium]
MSFKEIFCQDRAIDLLQRAFTSDRWAHAYIFAGPEGVGKFKTALEWARLLLCAEPVVEDGLADSCGLCQSCRLFEAGSHADFNHVYKELLEFTKDNKGRKTPVDLPIDVIREYLIARVSTRPTLSSRKVFVVSEAEKLNVASQNCLLKVLEEPPEYCSIVLLCTRLETLLPTTRSRCQTIRFGPVDECRTVEKLRDMGLEGKQAQYFARSAQGSLGTACKWAELELAGADLYEIKKRLLGSLARYEFAGALDLAQELLTDCKKVAETWAGLDEATSRTDINRRAARTVLQMIILALHDAMRFNAASTSEPVNFDQEQQIRKLAARFDAERAAEKIAECYRMLDWIESSVNEKLIFERLLLSLADSATMHV